MSALTRRGGRGLVEIFDWLEAPCTLLHPFAGQTMPIEERVENGRYVVRAEMPGIDPEKQAEVTLARGILTIHAERESAADNARHSEFRYGSITRHVALPESADEKDIEACYDNGIIEVSVALRASDEAALPGRRIPIRLNRHIDPT
jgi:HSP20 family protein